MRMLHSKTDKQHFKHIKERLKKRGMECSFNEGWAIHGPNPNMKHKVYVGPVKYSHLPDSFVYVAVYPVAVYKIDSRDKWENPKKEDRIPVRKRSKHPPPEPPG